MEQDVAVKQLLAEFRQLLPAQCLTAQAIDRQEPIDRIAVKAVEDGYIEYSQRFTQFMELCLRKGS